MPSQYKSGSLILKPVFKETRAMTSKDNLRKAEAIWSGTDATHVMENHETIRKYYEYANAGEWNAWCDLFTDDMVMDEQLAGHIVGLAALRPMMAGMGQSYARFQNVLEDMVVEGNQGAVVSHISALAA